MQDKKESPLVSVIISVYNVEAFIQPCIESLLYQTMKNIEFVFVNDGSTDKSIRFVKSAMESDDRIKLIEQQNLGADAARRAGVAVASGDYVGFVDGDDLIAAEMFEDMHRAATKFDADVIMCGYFSFRKSPDNRVAHSFTPMQIGGDDAPRDFYIYCVGASGSMWNKLFRREILSQSRPVEKLRIGEDLAFCTALAPFVKRAVIISECFYYYRIHAGSAMRSKMADSHETTLIDHFLMNIVPDTNYERLGSEAYNILAARAFVSVMFTRYMRFITMSFFIGIIDKLKGWDGFNSFIKSASRGDCFTPLVRGGGVARSFAVSVRVAFFLCRLKLYKLAALYLRLLAWVIKKRHFSDVYEV